ncbi:MAG: tRNA pseudouridine(55) synthase TruB [Candidatus Eiseniibacteriota bacterium]
MRRRAEPPADASAAPAYCGLLAVDKPTGMTSHDVVDRVRRRFRLRAVGHLGTLDPAASGLLVLALGPATRFAYVWQGGWKTYQGTVRFGLTTSTQDLQGEVLERSARCPQEHEIREATHAFVGEITQIPPMVSARRVGGERLYRIHARGETVERAPRPVSVRRWEWSRFEPPDADFELTCSGGTYVRTLAHDLGARLGTGATLAALRRLASEPFSIERTVSLRRLIAEPPETVWQEAGWTLERALAHLPQLALEPAESEQIGFGRQPEIAAERAATLPVGAGARSVVLAGAAGAVLGLGELQITERGTLRVCPHVLLPWAVRDGRVAGEQRSL